MNGNTINSLYLLLQSKFPPKEPELKTFDPVVAVLSVASCDDGNYTMD